MDTEKLQNNFKTIAISGLVGFSLGYILSRRSKPKKVEPEYPKNTFFLMEQDDSSLWEAVFSVFPNEYEILYKQIKAVPDEEPINIVITTHGGGFYWCQKICHVIRERKGIVRVFVKDYAHSAGSVIALSADEIHMNKYATMSAIDPQVDVLGYLSYMPLSKLGGIVQSKDNLVSYMNVMYEEIVDQGTLFSISKMKELGVEVQDWDGKQIPENPEDYKEENKDGEHDEENDGDE